MTTNKTTANETAREIADLQHQMADLISETARKADALNSEITQKTEAFRKAIIADRRGTFGTEAAEAIKTHRVNIGELSSQLCDAFEHRGHAVWPMQYEPIRAERALIENLI
jgi:F0F1-type ATP synthase membrane subunit b/b'